ncbi:hypothetical protein [Chondromyces apiculatus]|uniref:TIGR02646 family protein n=1 Tax=Chondromyces apiculatus DSM 436 TaxID=1192034 RepID=A0A017T951_9BACT|nr:hypothetical protein [Chondromyces apiculatus]EYF05111.1 Hypothetical protein CAP_3474 [Chondromyces apiculatus DSM 436]
MIRIRKPTTMPAVLQRRGAAARETLCAAYRRAAAVSSGGQIKLDFDAALYRHRTVKEALHAAHHGKCCYCESKVDHVAPGDVEHYRPKAAVQQLRRAPLEQPGYHWLAYTWSNLLFACVVCNGTHKRNLFPLLDPGKRARSRSARLRAEQPLLLNPAWEDPEGLIGFREEYAYARGGDVRARTTIEEVLLLNDRPPLLERRRDHLTVVQRMQDVASNPGVPEGIRDKARTWLDEQTADSAQYAAMTRNALRAIPVPAPRRASPSRSKRTR